ncbi:hypothetical protein Glove_547g6 [Diversispora epigaea]|uniref:Uncharacterized protein n=1 Tax=Diversispora epigaea TaxID=1348612 RepID=A0A397GGJ1_9GLOM|nr:hypothetical protein Glove_547g6 [Diversispora epigaea]
MSSVSQNMLLDFISFLENRKLKEEITELKRQNSQMEIDFEEKLEKSQENINQMKEEIDFLANINQQFGKKVFGNDSEEDTELDNEKNEKGARNEIKTIIKTINSEFKKLEKSQENINQMKEEIDFLANINQQFGKKVFGNDSEEDTELDNEKNEKGARNEIKTIIKTINSEFSLNYNQTFTSANNCEIRCKLIPELQKSLISKFRPSVMQLTKWLNSIHKS